MSYKTLSDLSAKPPSAPVQESELQLLLSRLQDANGRLVKLQDDLCITADRVFGPAPTAPQGVPAGAPDGSLPFLHMAIDVLHGLITSVEMQAERLAKL